MTTKNEYIAQIRSQNPKPHHSIVDGVQIELTDDEYEAVIDAWATMRVEQDAYEAQAAQLVATKRAAYVKLGLTDDEIDAILG